MSRKLFQSIVTFLYWGSNLAIALTTTLLLVGLFQQLLGLPGGFHVNEMPFENISKPIFKVPISFDMRDSFMDTTIIFRSKSQLIEQPELYQVARIFDADDEFDTEFLKKHNKAVLGRHKEGLLVPTDTLTASSLLFPQKYPINQQFYASISSPKKVEGFVKVSVNHLKNGWLIVVCNWLEVLLTISFFLYILICFNLLLQDIRKYRIFTSINFRRLRWIGVSWLVISLTSLFEIVRKYLIDKELGHIFIDFKNYHNGRLIYPSPFKMSIDYVDTIPISDFFIALAIIVLAEVFRKGFELQQEQDLTI